MGRLRCWFHCFAVCLLLLPKEAFLVEKHNFKTCDQSSFCKRHRSLPPQQAPFSVVNVVSANSESVSIEIKSYENPKPLLLQIFVFSGPIFRFKINEIEPLHPRYEVPFVIEQYPQMLAFTVSENSDDSLVLTYSERYKIIVVKRSLSILVIDSGEVVVHLNKDGLLKFEEYREKPETVGAPAEPDNEDDEDNEDDHEDAGEKDADAQPAAEEPMDKKDDVPSLDELQKGMWEESFKSHHDSKPKGPASIGMDIAFPGFKHIYGIPEHADAFSLKDTKDRDPYRLYNLDVFEYILDSPMALYGSIPVAVAQNTKRSVGVFWFNSAETWVDVDHPSENKPILKKLAAFVTAQPASELVTTHWMSESGIIDVFVMMGPTSKQVFAQYGSLTGFSPLPPMFAIGYHQCRWNYHDENDCRTVDAKFDEHDIPYDVLWLDIEHAVEKKYFTWDPHKFPNSKELLDDLNAKGRKMVTIVDPHIKRTSGYHVYDEGTRLGYFVKKSDGRTDYNGWCWPGDSSWVDFLNPLARTWWASLFGLEMYKGSALNLFTWNDMNEPSVFNGPEITMHKDSMHHGGVEHRDVHNLYGTLMIMSTWQGQLARSANQMRPFVLSRAFFAGSQRYGAVWTGDNYADWGHLRASMPMLLSMGVAGLPFVGADVGGFFKDPSPELLVRWYQLAAFTPFFRAHAHIETRRREPWLFGEENTKRIRNAIRRRYTFLPYWYTQFFKTSLTGVPIMRPYWVEFPEEESHFAKEDAFMVGPSLLVAPVVHEGSTSVTVTLPGRDTLWYDYSTLAAIKAPASFTAAADLDSIPVYYRGGSVIPIRERIRRSSPLARNDPITLIVAPDSQGNAVGDVYIDDEYTFEYRMGKFLYRQLQFSGSDMQLHSTRAKAVCAEPGYTTTTLPVHGNQSYNSKSWIERIIILNVPKKPTSAVLTIGAKKSKLEVLFDEASKSVTVRKPGMNVAEDFSLKLEL